MAGRGRGKSSSLNVIAQALGIGRGEMPASHATVALSPPPLFPPLEVKPLPLPDSYDLQYMAELKQELLTRFQESSSYLTDPQLKRTNRDIHRYTDKYRIVQTEPLTPRWNRLPKELCWMPAKRKDRTKRKSPVRKKIKLSDSPLKHLNDKEEEAEPTRGEASKEKDEEAEAKRRPAGDDDDPNVSFSDDDYQEEDNDYIDSYFDNGEKYEDDIGENADEDEAVF